MSAALDLNNSSFIPDAGNHRRLRDALGYFGTGVTIVTAASDNGVAAITVNSFSSVSLEPALVLWSIDRHSSRFEDFSTTDNYAIHILNADQESLCMEVARNPQRLDDKSMQTNTYGVPVLDKCLARFDCTREALYKAGDHCIILGRVKQASLFEESAPLAFYRGRTGTFATPSSSQS